MSLALQGDRRPWRFLDRCALCNRDVHGSGCPRAGPGQARPRNFLKKTGRVGPRACWAGPGRQL